MDTWVLLRGLTRSSAHWAGFAAELQTALSVRVITLDLPGNGALWQERSPATVAAMVRHCRAQLKALGVDQPVNLLAMSLGGMVAAEWALQQPLEVRHLVLLSTSLRPFSPPWQRMRPMSLLRLLRCALGRASADQWEREILALTTRHARHDVTQEWCRERRQRPVSAGNALRQLLAATRYRAPQQGPGVPTLVLAGAGDRLVSPQCAQALARHWGSSLQLHTTAGHDLTLDAGPWVALTVCHWLAGEAAAPPNAGPDA